MAMSHAQIQKQAMKAKDAKTDAKMRKACFGMPDHDGDRYADGGEVLGPEHDDQRPRTAMGQILGGSLASRPESMMQHVSPTDVTNMATSGMTGQPQAPSMFGSPMGASFSAGVNFGRPQAETVGPTVTAQPAVQPVATTAPLATPAPIVGTPIPPPVLGQLPRTQLPRAQLQQDPVIKANIQNKPVGYVDGGMVGEAAKTIGNRKAQVDAAEAAALAPAPKPVAPVALTPTPVATPSPEFKTGFFPTLKRAVFGFKDGGMVCPHGKTAGKCATCGYAHGGVVQGPGTGTSDSIPARLSRGEFVMPADSTAAIGPEKLEAMKNATHTPVAVKFGQNYANGYSPGDPFPEGLDIGPRPAVVPPATQNVPAVYNPVEGQRFGPARQPLPNVEPRIRAGVSPEAQDWAGRQAQNGYPRVPSPNDAPGFGPNGELAPATPAAEAPVGKARGLWNAIKGAPTAINEGAVGWGGKMLAGAAKYSLAAAPVIGAAQAAMDTDAQRAAYDKSMGTDNLPPTFAGDLGRNALRVADRIGNAATFGVAGRLGRGFSAASPYSLLGDTPDMGKALDSFATGFASDSPVQSTQSSAPSTTLPAPGAPAAAPAQSGLQAWQNAQLIKMGAGPGSGYQARPDLGAPGEQILRKGNSYVGVGGPSPSAAGGNITFGMPYGGYQNAGATKMPEPPEFQESSAANRVDARLSELSAKLEQMPPGTLGRRALIRDMAALGPVAAQLRAESTAYNQHAQTNYQNQSAMFGHALAYNSALAQNQVARNVAEYNHEKGMAEVANTKAERERQIKNDTYSRLNGEIESYAGGIHGPGTPEAKQAADAMKGIAAAMPFKDRAGNTKRFYDMAEGERDAPLAQMYGMAQSNQKMNKFGQPGSVTDSVPVRETGFGEGAYHLTTSPQDIPGAFMRGLETRGAPGDFSRVTSVREAPNTSVQVANARSHPAFKTLQQNPNADNIASARTALTARYGTEITKEALKPYIGNN